jgi:transcriptional regulator with XRE-family HTH domain
VASAQPLQSGVEGYVQRVIGNIQLLCDLWQLTPTAAAGRAGIAEAAIRNVMKGRNLPSFSTIVQLADAFGVDASWMMLPTAELARRVKREGVRPFVATPPGIVSPLSSGGSREGDVSEAAESRARIQGDRRTLPNSACDQLFYPVPTISLPRPYPTVAHLFTQVA